MSSAASKTRSKGNRLRPDVQTRRMKAALLGRLRFSPPELAVEDPPHALSMTALSAFYFLSIRLRVGQDRPCPKLVSEAARIVASGKMSATDAVLPILEGLSTNTISKMLLAGIGIDSCCIEGLALAAFGRWSGWQLLNERTNVIRRKS